MIQLVYYYNSIRLYNSLDDIHNFLARYFKIFGLMHVNVLIQITIKVYAMVISNWYESNFNLTTMTIIILMEVRLYVVIGAKGILRCSTKSLLTINNHQSTIYDPQLRLTIESL